MINTDDRLCDLDGILANFNLDIKGIKESALKNEEKLFLVRQLNNLIVVVETMKKAQL